MDVSTVFQNVLHAIENSKLNYVITKTPFSASIALKRSFVKFYDDTPNTKNVMQIDLKKEPLEDNHDLNEKLRVLVGQMEKLESLAESKNLKMMSLQTELDQAREDFKKEKNAFHSKIRTQKSEIEELSKTVKNLEEKVEVKVKALKVKDDACKEFKKGKTIAENKLKEIVIEFRTLQSVKEKLKCDFCDYKSERQANLKQHTRSNHFIDKVSQTEVESFHVEEIEFVNCEHSCFYCGFQFNLVQDIQYHKSECNEQWLLNNHLVIQEDGSVIPDPKLILKDEGNTLQCDECGAECGDRINLDGHVAEYHKLGAFFCDICPLQFSTNGDLYLHKLCCHGNDC